jgi:hypothetical protein
MVRCRHLTSLQSKTVHRSLFVVGVGQARRYRIWRLGHPYRDNIAVRIMVWFDGGEAVICLVAGNKAHLGDLWYDYAAPLAEVGIDRIITTQQ